MITFAQPGTSVAAVMIVNERAKGTIKRPKTLRAAIEALPGCRVFSTRSASALEGITQFCLEQDVGVVVLYGGDGTLSCALTRFFLDYREAKRPLPVFAPLMAGTMNTVVKGLGLKGGVVTLAKKLKEALAERGSLPVTEHEPLVVEGAEETLRLGFLGGVGLPASFLGHYYALGAKGPVDGLRTALQLIGSVIIRGEFAERLLAPLPVEILVNEARLELGPVCACLFGKVKSVGIKAKPLYFAPPPSGSVAYVATDFRPMRLLQKVIPVFMGNRLGSPGFCEGSAVRIELLSESLEGLELMVDGDVIPAKMPLCVRSGPSVRLFDPFSSKKEPL
jgi:diacylglycerol kinase family enzyme